MPISRVWPYQFFLRIFLFRRRYTVCNTGFLLADLYLLQWKEAPRHTFAWDLASLLGWPVLLAFTVTDHPSLSAPWILLAYIGAFRGTISNWLFSRPQLTVVGGMCYSIYLLQFSVISVTGRSGRFLLLPAAF